MTKDEYVKQHFPEVDPGVIPCGPQILVQLRTVTSKTKGGIILAEETKDFNNGNTQLAMVVSMGGIAYRNRDTGERWKEGVWVNIGDIVIMPRWGGFRFEVPVPGTDDKATFCIYADHEVKMVVYDKFENFDSIL